MDDNLETKLLLESQIIDVSKRYQNLQNNKVAVFANKEELLKSLKSGCLESIKNEFKVADKLTDEYLQQFVDRL